MNVKTVKGIKENKWLKFKSLAAEKNMPMGSLLELMIDDYSGHADAFWEKILSGEKILSNTDAEEIEKLTKELRKEHGFRS